ncbi:protein-l-isoaspartate(d-aspartate) o-methyltransferase-like [Lichtheimia corymbifera JMRC:FSU:9682]|uniref:protein-L-isoaspartate(D-aspartate) O-methyltransferase n=1 Tax=Lichtheimia corymbifera JMRC:FSU:9682 TaxID=1263082 RepID=A0A068SCR7_9FUNG|nr:protein-l-isoaspartate(d-aspartate) o-methyltransferase-like [Lichtheimia corymbifera JMRC:FSU:9682]
MAWRCTGKSNMELVENLKQAGIITKQRVVDAMNKIDRGDYAPRGAYLDEPQSIGYGATISAPHMHGYALDMMEEFLQPGMRALDVGSGSGYLTACMAEMVGPEGQVIGIEHIEQLVEASERNLSKEHPDWLENGRVKFVAGDGRKGYPEGEFYDCIHVGAASSDKPTELLRQLKSPGRCFVPVGGMLQKIIVYDKDKHGNIREKPEMGVMYVPLTDKNKQYPGGFNP